MAKLTAGLLAVCIAAGSTAVLTGCEDRRDITVLEAEEYLEALYGLDFTLDSRERLPGCHDNEYRKRYTFRDPEGTECRVFFDIEHTDKGWHYRVSEDYQVSYVIAHPELYQRLMDSGYYPEERWVQTSFRSRGGIVLYYDTYEDIAPAVAFASEVLGGIPQISGNSPEDMSLPYSVASDTAKVFFAQHGTEPDADSVWYLSFPLTAGTYNDSAAVTAGLQSSSAYAG